MTIREFVFGALKSMAVQAAACVVTVATWAYTTQTRLFVAEADISAIKTTQVENRAQTRSEILDLRAAMEKNQDKMDDKLDRVIHMMLQERRNR